LLSAIKTSQRRVLAIVELDGMFKKKITILIIHFGMLLVESEEDSMFGVDCMTIKVVLTEMFLQHLMHTQLPI